MGPCTRERKGLAVISLAGTIVGFEEMVAQWLSRYWIRIPGTGAKKRACCKEGVVEMVWCHVRLTRWQRVRRSSTGRLRRILERSLGFEKTLWVAWGLVLRLRLRFSTCWQTMSRGVVSDVSVSIASLVLGTWMSCAVESMSIAVSISVFCGEPMSI